MILNFRIFFLGVAIFTTSLSAVLLNFDQLAQGRSSQQVLQELIHSQTYLVIRFFKQGCGPCQQSTSIFRSFAQQNPSITFIEIDVSKYYDLFRPYNLNGVPAFVYYHNGDFKGFHKGAGPQLLQTLQTTVKQYFGL
jgi:thiol-disulfide isomerase/thioredoxin